MIFLTYDFVAFALAFFLVYALIPIPLVRVSLIVAASLAFQLFYGGIASLIPAVALAMLTWIAGLSGSRIVISVAIAVCTATLIFYKYTVFLAASLLALLLPDSPLPAAAQAIAPAVIPLGISFFVFEYVHYLVEVRRGQPSLRRASDFAAFAFFWPTMIAGPIRRYQQFVPALRLGTKQGSTAQDVAHGLIRISVGCLKKFVADNLTGWIDYIEPQLTNETLYVRWFFLGAIALRILFDFSGYSDMAIGYARIMGIKVPENFNWPYLAHNPGEFWQRWHISLSSWIRDYVYIPLGGNRLGLPRTVANALFAMVICGLWHGAAWNYAAWGLYHGFGLAFNSALQWFLRRVDLADNLIVRLICWPVTLLFVCLGWLLFFYPIAEAMFLASLMFKR